MNTRPIRYLNREISWLEFNQRVLNLAGSPEIPLLERVKFLAITAGNLDEFFKVRVGGLRLAQVNGTHQVDLTEMNVEQQLAVITDRVKSLTAEQDKIFTGILGDLHKNGIRKFDCESLSDDQLEFVERYFDDEVAATISPMAIGRDQPFPLLASAKLCLCIRLAVDKSKRLGPDTKSDSEEDRFVIIPIGNTFRRLFSLPDSDGFSFLLIEEIVEIFLGKFFPGQEVLDWTTFRITRNADIVLNEDMMLDLLQEMSQLLDARKESKIVRLEVDSQTSTEILTFLKEVTETDDQMIFKIEGPIDLTGLFELAAIHGFAKLKDEPWLPQPSPDFSDGANILDAIAEKDRLLIHPYQKFDPVVEFVQTAASDPNVIAIKQTLYRTSKNSKIVDALIEAAENGKQVTAIVELKARFDEERNIKGAKQLEQAGVDVIYGVRGLKTHAKLCIVVRRESRGIQRYVHFGTGNYNESTAKLYSDVSYFTNNEKLGYEAVMFFNAITGLSVPQPLRYLAAAPINLKDTLLDFIQAEIGNARRGGACEINAKLNSLADQQVIDALYEASQAGIKINLNIRGICCLRPGVPGLSENVRVISIVDRLLEHSRIIHFHHGGDDLVFISSADWMGRNLNRRAELMVPIEDSQCRQLLLSQLKLYFKDNVRASVLKADGTYSLDETAGNEPFRVQEYLFQQACDMYSAFSNPKATVFKAHRGESA